MLPCGSPIKYNSTPASATAPTRTSSAPAPDCALDGESRMVLSRALILVFALAAGSAPGMAEERRPSPPAAAAPQQQPAVSLEQALYLIRSALLTVNDANRSGNYSVLRDLAAPDFQAKNTAADLAQSFYDLRHRNFDLFSVALVAPQL